MDQIDFEVSANAFLQEAFERVQTKGDEYSLGHDRFEQLRRQAELNNMTTEEVIDVLMAKHLTVMLDTKREMKPAEFKERALDVIAYLTLLNGLYEEAGEM